MSPKEVVLSSPLTEEEELRIEELYRSFIGEFPQVGLNRVHDEILHTACEERVRADRNERPQDRDRHLNTFRRLLQTLCLTPDKIQKSEKAKRELASILFNTRSDKKIAP